MDVIDRKTARSPKNKQKEPWYLLYTSPFCHAGVSTIARFLLRAFRNCT